MGEISYLSKYGNGTVQGVFHRVAMIADSKMSVCFATCCSSFGMGDCEYKICNIAIITIFVI